MKSLQENGGITESKDSTEKVNISAKPHPLKDEVLHAEAAAGQTLYEVLGDIRPQAVVFHNGERIEHERLNEIVLSEDDIVNVAVVAHGGDNGNKVLRTVLQVAVIATTLALDVILPGAGTLLRAGIAAAIAVGGNLLINALVPTPGVGLDQGNSEAFNNIGGLTGSRNRLAPYSPVPRVYGRHRMFPPMSAKPYTEVQSNVQYLHMHLCVGFGPVRLHNPKIGDTVIGSFDSNNNFTPNGNFESVQIDVGETPDLYANDVDENSVSVTMDDSGTIATRTTVTDTQRAGIDFIFPRGLFRIDDDGETQTATVSFKIEYRETGTTGEWINPFERTIQDNNWDENRPDWEISREFGERRTEQRKYPYISFSGDERETLRNGAIISFPEAGQYDIRVERISGSSDENQQLFNSCTWTVLRSINFSNPVDMPGVVQIGMRIKATDQLTGVLDNFSVEVESRLPTWTAANGWDVPTFNPANGTGNGGALTDNPAWIVASILTGSANARSVNYDLLNAAELKDFADYCDSEGFGFNSPGDSKTTVFELLKAVCAAGRASFGIQEGLFTVVRENANQSPVQMFTPRNSWEFSAQRSYPDVPHALKVRFIDPENDWQENERIVYDDGYDEGTATRFEVLELAGVTDKDQAWKMGRYYLAAMRLRPEVYSFNVDVEHIVCSRGDLIKVAHDVPLWGISQGRLKSVSLDGNGDVTGLEIDEPATMEAGKDYVISIRTIEDMNVVGQVITDAGRHYKIQLETPIDANKMVGKGDIFSFGEKDREVVDLIVTGIQPRENLNAEITAIDAAPEIMDADTGQIPNYDSQITTPVDVESIQPDPPTIENIRSDETTTTRDIDGSFTARLVVSFSTSKGTPGLEVQGRYRKAGVGGGWTEVKTVNASNGTIAMPGVEIGQDYVIQIRSKSGQKTSVWVQARSNHTVAGKQGVPSEPTGFSIDLDKVALRAEWNQNPEGDIQEYEIRKGSDWASGTVIKQIKATETTMAVTETGNLTYWIKAIDTSGNYSATADNAVISIPNDWLQEVVRSGGSQVFSDVSINSKNPYLDYIESDIADKNWRTVSENGVFKLIEFDDEDSLVANPVSVNPGSPDDAIVVSANSVAINTQLLQAKKIESEGDIVAYKNGTPAGPSGGTYAANVMNLNDSGGTVAQINRNGTPLYNSDGTINEALYSAGSGGGAWGEVTGTLADQTDLQNALAAKASTFSNRAELDSITVTKISNWDTAFSHAQVRNSNPHRLSFDDLLDKPFNSLSNDFQVNGGVASVRDDLFDSRYYQPGDSISVPLSWSSTTLSGNAIYVQNSNDGFGIGVGTTVSTWFSYDSARGVKRAIDVWNDASKIILGRDGARTGMQANSGVFGDSSYLTFFKDETLSSRFGYVGKGASGNTDIYVRADQGSIKLFPSSGKVYIGNNDTHEVWHKGIFNNPFPSGGDQALGTNDNVQFAGLTLGDNEALRFVANNGALQRGDGRTQGNKANIHWYGNSPDGSTTEARHYYWDGDSYVSLTSINSNLRINNNQIWHAGNDGSGSGLDADFLDGIDSSRIIFGDNNTGSLNRANANDEIRKSGFYRTNEGPTALLIHSSHATNSSYAFQIGKDYSSNGLLYHRSLNNGNWGSYARIWDDKAFSNPFPNDGDQDLGENSSPLFNNVALPRSGELRLGRRGESNIVLHRRDTESWLPERILGPSLSGYFGGVLSTTKDGESGRNWSLHWTDAGDVNVRNRFSANTIESKGDIIAYAN